MIERTTFLYSAILLAQHTIISHSLSGRRREFVVYFGMFKASTEGDGRKI